VFTQMLPICEALEQTVRQYEQNTISISFVLKRNDVSELNPDQINQSFMYTLVLKDILLTIPFDKLDFKEFIDCCRDSYANNETELKIIDELEHKYHKDKSIWWYTREGFLYRVLNQALRSMDIDVIIIMGFFIQDLHNRIKKLHSKQFGDRHSAKPFVVYRGQVLSNKVFDQMEKANGGLVSFNSFLSTSKDHKVAEKFARRALTKEDSIGIIFVMTIDPSISSTPFASISNISYYQKENEILFSMHTVFLIDDIKLIDDNACLWQVNLTQTRNNAHQLCALTKRLRDEVKGFTGWDEFGRILIKLGQLKKAQEVYMAMLQKTSNDYDKANIYNQLGCIKDIQGENAESITFYKKSLEIIEENGPKDYSDTSYYFNLASSYNNIGVLYDRMGEYSDALLYHKKAFELRQKICHPLHPDQAGSYTNLGLSYKKMKDDSNALSSLQQALEIRRKNLPADHLDLAQSYLNLVSLFEQMGKHVEARSYCEKALAIQEKTLPSNHPALVKTRNYIKQISSKKTTSRDGSSD
jgi:tetratricopeptide (TPR) repeat protein